MIRVWVGETVGDYAEVPAARHWSLAVALDGEPTAVALDGQPLGEDAWSFDPRRGELLVVPMPGPFRLDITL